MLQVVVKVRGNREALTTDLSGVSPQGTAGSEFNNLANNSKLQTCR